MSLIAWYPLTGTLKDFSGNNYHLTQQGSDLSVSNNGKIGSCYGITVNKMSRLSSPSNNYFKDDCSMFCWVNVTQLSNTDSANGVITNHGHSSESGMGITLKARSSNTYSVSCNTGYNEGGRTYNTFYGNSSLNINKWYHIGFTYNSKTKKISFYVNGNLDGEHTIPSDKTMKYKNSPITIFAWSLEYLDSTSYRPGQRINDVRIYDHVLSLKEIKEIYKSKIVHFKLDDPSDEPMSNLGSVSLCTKEYYGGSLRDLGSYYSKSNTRITATNQPGGGPIPGWRIDMQSGNTITISGYTNLSSINYYYRGFNSSNTVIFTQRSGSINVVNGYYTLSITVSDSNLSYIHIGIGSTANSANYYLDKTQIELKASNTVYIEGNRNGIIRDSSGYCNHGTCVTYPKWIKDTPFGLGAYQFNNNPIKCAGSVLPISSPQEWTVSCWVKFSSNPTSVQYLTNINLGVRLHNSSIKSLIYINNNTNDWYKYSTTLQNPTSWFHFVGTFNQEKNSIKIWINGKNCIDTSGPSNNGSKTPAGVQSILTLFESFVGCATDFRLYATELSDSDIKELYESKASLSKNGKMFVQHIFEKTHRNNLIKPNDISVSNLTTTGISITNADSFGRRRIRNGSKTGQFRISFPLNILTPYVNKNLSFSFNYRFITGNSFTLIDWCDGGIKKLQNSGFIKIQGSRSSYDNIYRFVDAEIGANVEIEIWNLKLEQDNIDNYKSYIDKKGIIYSEEINEYNFKPTLVDYSQWVIGNSSVGQWSCNGSSSENKVILKDNPLGVLDIVWSTESNDSASDGDGGWNVINIPIDKSKKYRFTCWIRRENVGDGRTYFGCLGSSVCDLGTTTVNTNPYFHNRVIADLPELRDNWCLFVGYIHPYNYTGDNDSTNGFYRGDTKQRTRGCSDFKWTSNATVGGIRSYLFYSTSTTEKQYWYRPRFEVCDGKEPSIEELLSCCEHLPLVDSYGVPLSKEVFSLNKYGSVKANEFIEY